MYVTKQQAEDLLNEFLENVKKDLANKTDFLFTLLEGDDWSLVIKAHALIESLLTELIIAKISDNTMVDIIDRIPLHGQYVSKTQILKAYKLISNEQISFISKFSEVRNIIVHKFENVNFSFEEYFSNLDKNQIKSWRNLLKSERVQESTMTKLLDEKPKLAVWVKLLEIMATFLTKNFELRTNSKIEKAAHTTISEYMVSTKSD